MGMVQSFYSFLLLAVIVAGEFAALHSLATGEASDGNPRWVTGALVTALVGVAVLGMGAGLDEASEPPE